MPINTSIIKYLESQNPKLRANNTKDFKVRFQKRVERQVAEKKDILDAVAIVNGYLGAGADQTQFRTRLCSSVRKSPPRRSPLLPTSALHIEHCT